ncbi:MAG: hypothetical protein ACKVTZ_20640, partial [Bacteroidia bacterium]
MRQPVIYSHLLGLVFFCFSSLPFYAQKGTSEFIENKGQWADYIQYRQRLFQGDFLAAKDRFVYQLREDKENPFGHKNHKHHTSHEETEESPTYQGHIYQARFVGASSQTKIIANKPSEGVFNYYLGKDPQHWASGAKAYQSLRYQNLYEGVDMEVYGVGSNLKYDFIVKPQSSPAQIQIAYEGVNDLKIDEKGNLHIKLSVPEVQELAPVAYQMIQGKRQKVDCHYQLTGDVLSFVFPNDYDHSEALIIDPTVVFSTYTGSTQDNWGFT